MTMRCIRDAFALSAVLHGVAAFQKDQQVSVATENTNLKDTVAVIQTDQQSVAAMLGQLRWLRKTEKEVQTYSKEVLEHLVAHRAFHKVGDGMSRPLENTIEAFTWAWSNGIKYCECDVAVLKSGEIILAHDDENKRLALDGEASRDNFAAQTMAQILRDPLKNGGSPPLLSEVLKRAKALNGKLVVELKPGASSESIMKIYEDENSSDDALESIGVIMSFDYDSIKNFKKLYKKQGLSPDQCPKVLHLKVAQESVPKVDFEKIVSLDNLKNDKIEIDDEEIDGVYLEWMPEFLQEPYRGHLKTLCENMEVGVWTYGESHYKKQPDRLSIAKELVDLGVNFVNTDLPSSFVKETGKVAAMVTAFEKFPIGG